MSHEDGCFQAYRWWVSSPSLRSHDTFLSSLGVMMFNVVCAPLLPRGGGGVMIFV